jgi:hypothetical protein
MRVRQDVLHPASLTRVTVHRPAVARRAGLAVLLVVLYASAGAFVYRTIGDPLRMALSEAEKLDEAAWDALEDFGASEAAVQGTAASATPEEDDFEETRPVAASASSSRPGPAGGRKAAAATVTKSRTRAAKSVADAIAAKAKEGVEDVDGAARRPLPSSAMPSPWAVVALFAVVTLHVLFHLVCRWIVPFRAATLFCPATSIGVCVGGGRGERDDGRPG